MLTVPSPIASFSPSSTTNSGRNRNSIVLFSPRIRALWIFLALLTVVPELLPVAPMPLGLFGLYYVLKVMSFCLLGFLAPLSFRGLNGIGSALSISFGTALVVETFQGFLHNGHVFHWYELVGKLALIVLGFAIALECRYEGKLHFGFLRLNFSQEISNVRS